MAAKNNTKDIEAAVETKRKAQQRFDTARAKRDELTNAFKVDEANFLQALQKAEAETSASPKLFQ